MRIDLHVHSDISPCSAIPLDDVIAIAAGHGLDGVCITDHDTTAAMGRLTPGIQGNGLLLVIGMEYTTPEGDFLLYGDLHGLPMGLPAAELLTRIDAREAVAVAAHPLRQWRAIDERLVAAGRCRIIEEINGRNTDAENERAAAWRTRYGINGVGGSDAHTPAEIGSVCTFFPPAIRSTTAFVRALRTGIGTPIINTVPLAADGTGRHRRTTAHPFAGTPFQGYPATRTGS
ncbi:MAG: PHP domain-containing protein [Deltaproteobacteria bacterium]|nr:PHP domain-containing protein [Candidatus Anaeroferrophillacea bacterium]